MQTVTDYPKKRECKLTGIGQMFKGSQTSFLLTTFLNSICMKNFSGIQVNKNLKTTILQ